MSGETTVSGASDDLIEVEGAIRAEFHVLGEGDDGSLLAFSNGVVLRVCYTEEGLWRITPLRGASGVTVTFADAEDEDCYSDRAVLHELVGWVVLGSEIAGRP